jgi:hypothetical protein
LHKNSLIYNVLVNFFFVKLPNFVFLPIIVILYYIHRSRFPKNKKINKCNGTLGLIESIISTYNRRMINKNRNMLKLLQFQGNLNKKLKFTLLNDEVQLYLLRNLVYRILNKCIPQSKVRKLVKMEILRAPGGTFSDYVHLCDELKKESNFVP